MMSNYTQQIKEPPIMKPRFSSSSCY